MTTFYIVSHTKKKLKLSHEDASLEVGFTLVSSAHNEELRIRFESALDSI